MGSGLNPSKKQKLYQAPSRRRIWYHKYWFRASSLWILQTQVDISLNIIRSFLPDSASGQRALPTASVNHLIRFPFRLKQWSNLPPAAANQVRKQAASAPRKPNVPVARRRPCSAIVRGQQLRTWSKARDAHVVSAPIISPSLLVSTPAPTSVRGHAFFCGYQVVGTEYFIGAGRYADTLPKKPGARPAGACTCERAATENKAVNGATCSCGKRPAGTFVFFSLSNFPIRVQIFFHAFVNESFKFGWSIRSLFKETKLI